MNRSIFSRLLAIALVVLAWGSQNAFAANDGDQDKFYVFGMFGSAKATDIGKSDADATLRAAGATNLSSSVKDTASAAMVGVGFKLVPHAAIELSYVKTADYEYNATFTQGTANVKISASGYGASLVGFAPLGDVVTAFGKIGIYNFTVDTSATVRAAGVGSASDSGSGTSPAFGAGLDFRLGRSVKVRIEYDFFKKVGDDATVGTSDVNFLAAGIVVGF